MENRENILSDLRSIGIIDETTSEAEAFQNQTLRPILKKQNSLFMAIFSHYFTQHKNIFHPLCIAEKEQYLQTIFRKDAQFVGFLTGTIVGMFSLSEYQTYTQNTQELNKRMRKMLQERIRSQLGDF